MSDEKSRLGKGLEAIFGDSVSSVLDDIQNSQNQHTEKLPVRQIHPNPYQPRKHFDEEKLKELSVSIKEHGVFTPILVRKTLHGYQLIAGERRLRATKLAGLEEIPAIVLDFDDNQMMEVSLIENIQREDLSIVEEARAYQNMLERLDITQETLAKKLGKSRTHITNILRLLQLPEEVLDRVNAGALSMGQVRPLISIEDRNRLVELAKKIEKDRLSAREVERLVKAKPKTASVKEKISDYSYVEKLLRDKLMTKVNVEGHQVKIHFETDDDLNRILELLNVLEDV